MALVRKCTKCGFHRDIVGSTNKRDAFGNAIFICAKCVKKEEEFPKGNLSPLIENVSKSEP